MKQGFTSSPQSRKRNFIFGNILPHSPTKKIKFLASAKKNNVDRVLALCRPQGQQSTATNAAELSENCVKSLNERQWHGLPLE
jgi:hypothetical protein